MTLRCLEAGAGFHREKGNVEMKSNDGANLTNVEGMDRAPGDLPANPHYALRYGWQEMELDLTEIWHMAEGMRGVRQAGTE